MKTLEKTLTEQIEQKLFLENMKKKYRFYEMQLADIALANQIKRLKKKYKLKWTRKLEIKILSKALECNYVKLEDAYKSIKRMEK